MAKPRAVPAAVVDPSSPSSSSTSPSSEASTSTAGPLPTLPFLVQPAAAPPPPVDADPFEEDPPPVELEEEERLLPEGFDLFALDPTRVAKLQADGVDCRVQRVRFYAVGVDGRRGESLRTVTAHGLNMAWVRQAFRPGLYDFQGLNAGGSWIGGRRCHLTGPAPAHAPAPWFGGTLPGAPAVGAAPYQWDPNAPPPQPTDLTQQIVAIALQRLLAPPDQGSPIADMVKAMTAMSGLMTTSVQTQLTLMNARQSQDQSSPAARAESQLFELVRDQLKAAQAAAAAATRSGGGAGGSKADLQTMLTILKFGMDLKDSQHATPGQPKDESKIVEILMGLVETFGPAAMALIAQFLPPEQAKLVCSVIEEHQKARAAEAAGEPIDTEGHTVQ